VDCSQIRSISSSISWPKRFTSFIRISRRDIKKLRQEADLSKARLVFRGEAFVGIRVKEVQFSLHSSDEFVGECPRFAGMRLVAGCGDYL
jgi:hypothetical protein